MECDPLSKRGAHESPDQYVDQSTEVLKVLTRNLFTCACQGSLWYPYIASRNPGSLGQEGEQGASPPAGSLLVATELLVTKPSPSASTNAVPQCQDPAKLDQTPIAQHNRGNLPPTSYCSYPFEQSHNSHQRKYKGSSWIGESPMAATAFSWKWSTMQHLNLPRCLLQSYLCGT